EKEKRWRSVARQPTLGDGVKRFTEHVMAVAEDTGSNLVRLRVDWYDAHEAADWANDLVSRLNETMRNRAMARANQGIQFLNTELDKQSVVEVRQVIYRLLEGQLQSAMMANVNREFALRVLDPAVAPDRDKFVRPQRILLMALGLIAGFSLGCFTAIVLA